MDRDDTICDRVAKFTNLEPGVTYTTNLMFDIEAKVRWVHASAIGKNLPEDPRDAFEVQLELSTGRRFQSDFALASTICGTPDKPRKLDPAWASFDIRRGMHMRIHVRALQPLERVDIVLDTKETWRIKWE